MLCAALAIMQSHVHNMLQLSKRTNWIIAGATTWWRANVTEARRRRIDPAELERMPQAGLEFRDWSDATALGTNGIHQ